MVKLVNVIHIILWDIDYQYNKNVFHFSIKWGTLNEKYICVQNKIKLKTAYKTTIWAKYNLKITYCDDGYKNAFSVLHVHGACDFSKLCTH